MLRSWKAWCSALGSILLFSLSSCHELKSVGGGSAGCSNSENQQLVVKDLKRELENRMSNSDSGRFFFSLGEISKALEQVTFSFEDVRSADDPNSRKKFCSATLKADFPDGFLKDADRRLYLSRLPTVARALATVGGERVGSTFKIPVRFYVQPTDDGSKVFAEILDGDADYDFISTLLTPHLSGKMFDEMDRNEARREQMLTDQAGDSEVTANGESSPSEADSASHVTLDQAKAEYAAAEEALNSTWNALPAGQRGQLLTEQREWISSKGLPCRIEAANMTSDRPSFEIAEIKCQIRADNERTEELRRLSSQDGT